MKTYKSEIFNSLGGYPVELIDHEIEFKQPERLNEKTFKKIPEEWVIDLRDATV